MELQDALSQISEIRQHMARTQVFRGYRSATTALSGAMALAAAAAQAVWIPRPIEHVRAYLVLWVSVATLSAIVVACEMILRTRRSHSSLQGDANVVAVEGNRLVMGCGQGTGLELLELQLQGKRRMSAGDFVNGYHPRSGERLGG